MRSEFDLELRTVDSSAGSLPVTVLCLVARSRDEGAALLDSMERILFPPGGTSSTSLSFFRDEAARTATFRYVADSHAGQLDLTLQGVPFETPQKTLATLQATGAVVMTFAYYDSDGDLTFFPPSNNSLSRREMILDGETVIGRSTGFDWKGHLRGLEEAVRVG